MNNLLPLKSLQNSAKGPLGLCLIALRLLPYALSFKPYALRFTPLLYKHRLIYNPSIGSRSQASSFTAQAQLINEICRNGKFRIGD